MKIHRARHSLQLAVSQLSVTEAFYAGILELPVQRSFTSQGAPDYLVMDMDDLALIFVEEDDVIRSHPMLEPRFSMFPRGIGMTLHFRVTDIEDISEAIVDEGLEVLYPLEVKPYGIKEMWCFDPDGYLVVLDEPVEKRKKAGP
ncbi:VOC family protein [Geobacter sp. FeAm09]|uniref:VOC family protein n=1 Tax=Geobacter sp. FeAm09 TaxID=2597769 RepID=UPI0011ED936C|nr:VOC family protein [Geobacter sp. FeAm09]QEM68338.1 VOC family protein [Geobacter sp. FeAm09]